MKTPLTGWRLRFAEIMAFGLLWAAAMLCVHLVVEVNAQPPAIESPVRIGGKLSGVWRTYDAQLRVACYTYDLAISCVQVAR